MNSKLIIQLAFLLIAATGINWYLNSLDRESDKTSIGQNDPDLYMSNASLRQFNPEGKLQHQIRATRFTHYPESDITTLKEPDITLYKVGTPPWQIKSKMGRILPDQGTQGSTLELWNSVFVDRTTDEGKYIHIRSENLTVLPEQNYAETDQTVIIEENSSQTTASGMSAHLKSGKFIFYSNPEQRVNTIILPTHDQI